MWATAAGFGIPVPPDPREVRERLVACRAGTGSAEPVLELPDVPPVADRIPGDVLAIRRGRGELVDALPAGQRLSRWRVTFISESRR
jgi:hypothetical protein